MCRSDHPHHCLHVPTILTPSSVIDVSPLPSLHPLIHADHHTEFPVDNTPQWHSSSLTAPATIHSSFLPASSSRALTCVTLTGMFTCPLHQLIMQSSACSLHTAAPPLHISNPFHHQSTFHHKYQALSIPITFSNVNKDKT